MVQQYKQNSEKNSFSLSGKIGGGSRDKRNEETSIGDTNRTTYLTGG